MGHAKMLDLLPGIPSFTPTSFTLEIGTNCSNPNFYTIGFAYSEKGKVTMGQEKTPVGWAMESPYSHSLLPAGGSGTVWATAQVSISGAMLSSLLP